MESKYPQIIFSLLFCFLYAFPPLQTGDVILRKEANVLSDLFAQIDPCGYSHSGIIVMLKNKPYVLNIEYETNKNNIKIVPLKKFLKLSSKYCFLKPKIKINQTKFKKFILSLKNKNIKFDTDISLNNNKFYCTELVDYVYYTNTHKHIYAYLYNFNNKKIITIRSILKSKYLERIH